MMEIMKSVFANKFKQHHGNARDLIVSVWLFKGGEADARA